MMLTLGVDIYTTSKLLGHANVTTTAIYAKIVDKKKVDAMNLVNDLFTKDDNTVNYILGGGLVFAHVTTFKILNPNSVKILAIEKIL